MTKKTDVPRSLGKPSVCISSIGNCAWICWSSWWYLRRFMGFWLWLNGRMRSQLQYIYNIIIYEIIYDILLWWWSYPSNPISMSQDLAITGDVMAPTTQPPNHPAAAHVQHGQLAVVWWALNVSSREEKKGLSRKPCMSRHNKYEDNNKKRKNECCDLS